MKLAIIGAGAAGLAALRHSLDEGHQCEVFEQTGKVGGTWNYTDKVGKDDNGLPIHSSMYEGLSTNLPKELMQFEDFPFKTPEHSYISQPEVLQYINDYAVFFKLLPHIQFYKYIVEVSPLSTERWSVTVKDMRTGIVEQKEFDAIFVCVGNYSVPSITEFAGVNNFEGIIIHSHDYRKAEPYRNRTVLVVGSGPSGLDISRIVSGVAHKVLLSHRSALHSAFKLSQNVTTKPEIKEFKNNSVVFKDDTEEVVDDVIFCTGYQYSYPFLTDQCGIEVENKWVKFLYKHVINVNHPTMAFIAVPFRIFPFVIFGIQIRFFLAYLKGQFSVTKEEMMTEVIDSMLKKQESGIPLRYAHLIGLGQGEYMDNLAETANITRVPPVYHKLYTHVHSVGKGNTNPCYKLVNDNEFVQTGN